MITETGSALEVDLTQTVPPALTYDEKSIALNQAIAKAIQKNLEEEIVVGFYYRIQELSERACDILAADMHVDWYDYDWSLEQKRNAIETNVAIHRKKGTAWAVKRAISAITTGTATITEWFEYDGEPYRFQITITEGDDPSNYTDLDQILKAVNIYKPVRARIDGLTRGSSSEESYEAHYATATTAFSTEEMGVVDTAGHAAILGMFVLGADAIE